MSDDPGTYSFADPPPPKRRFVPRARRRFVDSEESFPQPAEPWWAFDWFWPALFVAVGLWVGLGLLAAKWQGIGWVLAAVGLAVVAFGQFYLYMLVREQDGWEQALLTYLFSWHRFLYLHQNIEMTLKPKVLSAIGLLMVLTGIGLALVGLRPKP